MRKRLSLTWVLVVLAVGMALPASTVAADGNTYKILHNYCDGANPIRLLVDRDDAIRRHAELPVLGACDCPQR